MKKRVKKQKSILQNQENKQCYLCMLLEGNYAYQTVEDHHIFFGPNRRNSEIHGFKVNLCIRHHREGKEAVHLNRENDLILKEICQKEYEKTHTDRNLSRLSENPILVGDSREFDFTIRNGILKADFLKTGRKNGIESPLSTFFVWIETVESL